MNNEVQIDILQNGGSVADVLMKNGFDVSNLRSFIDNDGRSYINNAEGQKLTANATLLKDEWIALDTAVSQVARDQLTLVDDLRSMGMTYNLRNALGITVLQYQNMSDINDAQVSMSPINAGDNDRPKFDLTSLPIPIVSKKFYFDARELNTSRNMGQPIDTSNATMSSRKVSEAIEKLFTGTYGTYAFGGGNIYGLRNFPKRITTTVSDWTASAKTNEKRLADVLSLLNTMRSNKQYGPYAMYVANDLEQYLDDDYKADSDLTLRERILKIGMDRNDAGKMRTVKALDYLTAGDIIIVNLGAPTRPIEVVDGMMPTTVQWQTDGGMLYHFLVMAIMVPRCRADYNDKAGILHATQA